MKTLTEVTIHDVKVLTQSCEEAKKEALKFMYAGDLNNYFKKLLEISHMQDELEYELAA